MTCSTASNSGKFAWSGVGIGEGTTLKGITFRLSDFFFNKGLEHESGFFIATPCTHHSKCSDWETVSHYRTIARLWALLKAYSGEWAWKAVRDMLRRAYYLSRDVHVRKIRDRKQRTDKGKYSFVNRIHNWKQLPKDALGIFFCQPKILGLELGKQL